MSGIDLNGLLIVCVVAVLICSRTYYRQLSRKGRIHSDSYMWTLEKPKGFLVRSHLSSCMDGNLVTFANIVTFIHPIMWLSLLECRIDMNKLDSESSIRNMFVNV